jgi:hypothetical protein
MAENSFVAISEALSEPGVPFPAFPDFKPVAYYNKGTDALIVLEKDCSYTEVPQPGSNISLLYENHGEEGKERNLVGVMIEGFSSIAGFTVTAKEKIVQSTQ